MWLPAFLLIPLLAYGALLAAIYFRQSAMLFPSASVAPPGPAPAGTERVQLTSEAGDRLVGLLIPPARAGGERLLILGFGGNAWNAQSAAEYLHELYPQAHVLAFHYRGYSPSEGKAGSEALKKDSLLIHDHARSRFGDIRTIAVGFSIGSGVAAHLAGKRQIDGAILVTPFDSLRLVAASLYPWLPVRYLFREPMDPIVDLQGSAVPVAIIAAGDDRLIRPERTRRLAEKVDRLVFHRIIEGASHNDIYDRESFRSAMHKALEELD